MNLGVIGSRSYKNINNVDLVMHKYHEYLFEVSVPFPVVVSGGADGPDSRAVEVAKELHWPTPDVNKPAYYIYGRYKAPFVRNGVIAQKSDVIWAFWDGESGGTFDTIQKALALGKTVIIFPDIKEIKYLDMNAQGW